MPIPPTYMLLTMLKLLYHCPLSICCDSVLYITIQSPGHHFDELGHKHNLGISCERSSLHSRTESQKLTMWFGRYFKNWRKHKWCYVHTTDTTFSLQSHNELLFIFSLYLQSNFFVKEKILISRVAQSNDHYRFWTRRSFHKPWADEEEEARKCLFPCSPARCSEAGLFGLICFLQQQKKKEF